MNRKKLESKQQGGISAGFKKIRIICHWRYDNKRKTQPISELMFKGKFLSADGLGVSLEPR